MKGKLGCSFSIMLACVACPRLACETRYVSKTGSNEPPYTTPETAARTIQAALDISSSGDTVLVGPGEYQESITLKREGITLIGAGRDCCRIIVPEGEGTVGIVGESRVVELRGFAVVGGETGISMFGGNDYVLIADCRVEGAAERGLVIRGWVDITVVNTDFRAVRTGIEVMRDEDPWAEVGLRASGCQFIDVVDGIQAGSRSMTEVTQSTFLRYRYGVYDTWGAATLVDSCTFLEGRCAISAMTMDGVLRVSNCVFALNTREAIETDQRGLVADSLFYANDYAYNEWDGGYEVDFIRCTFVSNGTALGQVPRLVRDCIFWQNGEDVPYYPDGFWPETMILDHCFIDNPDLAGKNGNISGDPGLAKWWRGFNHTDNPIHVDGSIRYGGDGSAERPFPSLQEALVNFEFGLAEDSICLGAGAVGGDIGYRPGIVPGGADAAARVAIEMAPSTYEIGPLVVPGDVTLFGAEGASKRPCLLSGGEGELWESGWVVEEGAILRGLDFQDATVTAYGAGLFDCRFFRGALGLDGSFAAGCQVLGGFAALGHNHSKMVGCLLAGPTALPGLLTLGICHADQPHEILNCTIAGGERIIAAFECEDGVSAKVANCIVWGGVDAHTDCLEATECLFLNGWPGEGNIEGDPMFVDAQNGDFRLRADSPCIDAGSLRAALRTELSVGDEEARLSWSPGEDLDGNPRISGSGVDMGAYEYQSTPADYVVERSSDLATWQEAGTTSGSEWIDVPITGIRQRFYRVGLSP